MRDSPVDLPDSRPPQSITEQATRAAIGAVPFIVKVSFVTLIVMVIIPFWIHATVGLEIKRQVKSAMAEVAGYNHDGVADTLVLHFDKWPAKGSGE